MTSLALLPPLAALCSELLLSQLPSPPPAAAAFPLPQITAVATQTSDRTTFQAPPGRRPYQLIYHPPAKACVRGPVGDKEPPVLEPCGQSGYTWYYSPQKFLTVQTTYFCLKAVGPGEAARFSIRCNESESAWVQESDGVRGKTRLVTRLPDGSPPLCLEATPDGGLVTGACAAGNDAQWFEIVTVDKSGKGTASAESGGDP